jgi:hypothetical protein
MNQQLGSCLNPPMRESPHAQEHIRLTLKIWKVHVGLIYSWPRRNFKCAWFWMVSIILIYFCNERNSLEHGRPWQALFQAIMFKEWFRQELQSCFDRILFHKHLEGWWISFSQECCISVSRIAEFHMQLRGDGSVLFSSASNLRCNMDYGAHKWSHYIVRSGL